MAFYGGSITGHHRIQAHNTQLGSTGTIQPRNVSGGVGLSATSTLRGPVTSSPAQLAATQVLGGTGAFYSQRRATGPTMSNTTAPYSNSQSIPTSELTLSTDAPPIVPGSGVPMVPTMLFSPPEASYSSSRVSFAGHRVNGAGTAANGAGHHPHGRHHAHPSQHNAPPHAPLAIGNPALAVPLAPSTLPFSRPGSGFGPGGKVISDGTVVSTTLNTSLVPNVGQAPVPTVTASTTATAPSVMHSPLRPPASRHSANQNAASPANTNSSNNSSNNSSSSSVGSRYYDAYQASASVSSPFSPSSTNITTTASSPFTLSPRPPSPSSSSSSSSSSSGLAAPVGKVSTLLCPTFPAAHFGMQGARSTMEDEYIIDMNQVVHTYLLNNDYLNATSRTPSATASSSSSSTFSSTTSSAVSSLPPAALQPSPHSISLFAIVDGHGGRAAAQFIRARLMAVLKDELERPHPPLPPLPDGAGPSSSSSSSMSSISRFSNPAGRLAGRPSSGLSGQAPPSSAHPTVESALRHAFVRVDKEYVASVLCDTYGSPRHQQQQGGGRYSGNTRASTGGMGGLNDPLVITGLSSGGGSGPNFNQPTTLPHHYSSISPRTASTNRPGVRDDPPDSTAGAVLSVALIHPHSGRLWVANLGDCRCVLASSTRLGGANSGGFNMYSSPSLQRRISATDPSASFGGGNYTTSTSNNSGSALRWHDQSQTFFAQLLTKDHKAVTASEVQRVIRAGGNISSGRVNGELAVTRAIGDVTFKRIAVLDIPTVNGLATPVASFNNNTIPFGRRGSNSSLSRSLENGNLLSGGRVTTTGSNVHAWQDPTDPCTGSCGGVPFTYDVQGPVTAYPDVFEVRLTSEDSFLILACDGVWDVLAGQGAVETVSKTILDSARSMELFAGPVGSNSNSSNNGVAGGGAGNVGGAGSGPGGLGPSATPSSRVTDQFGSFDSSALAAINRRASLNALLNSSASSSTSQAGGSNKTQQLPDIPPESVIQAAAESLSKKAFDTGSNDNISCVIVWIGGVIQDAKAALQKRIESARAAGIPIETPISPPGYASSGLSTNNNNGGGNNNGATSSSSATTPGGRSSFSNAAGSDLAGGDAAGGAGGANASAVGVGAARRPSGSRLLLTVGPSASMKPTAGANKSTGTGGAGGAGPSPMDTVTASMNRLLMTKPASTSSSTASSSSSSTSSSSSFSNFNGVASLPIPASRGRGTMGSAGSTSASTQSAASRATGGGIVGRAVGGAATAGAGATGAGARNRLSGPSASPALSGRAAEPTIVGIPSVPQNASSSSSSSTTTAGRPRSGNRTAASRTGQPRY